MPGNVAFLLFRSIFSFKTGRGEFRAFLSGFVTVPASVCVLCVCVRLGGGLGVPLWFYFFFSRIMAGSHTLLYKLDPGL